MKIRSLLPIACWGDHLDVFRASESIAYCQRQLAIVDEDGLRLFAIRNALAGQLTCDPNDDSRSDGFAPAECRGNPGRKRQWGVESTKRSAVAARNLGARGDQSNGLSDLPPALPFPAVRRSRDRGGLPHVHGDVEADS